MLGPEMAHALTVEPETALKRGHRIDLHSTFPPAAA
jgi:hypothetical protein